ncbi:MAG: hypothetical protein ACLPQ0_05555 [Candidatus Binatus sp.]
MREVMPRRKLRISTIAVLGAVAFAMLACAGCFDTGAPNPPVRVDPITHATNERDAALLADKRAVDDAWKACTPAIDRSARECERVCPIDLPLPEIRSLTTEELIDRISKKCVESHGAAWLGGLDDAQSLSLALSLGSPRAAEAGRPCDVVATEQLKKFKEGPDLDRSARECERVCPIDLPLPEIKSLTTKELVDRISESCARRNLFECSAVSIRKGNAGPGVVGEDGLGVLENIDPACDAAIHVVRLKKKAINDANDSIRAMRSYDEEELRHPANTMCNPTGYGGFNCYSY